MLTIGSLTCVVNASVTASGDHANASGPSLSG